MHLEINYANSRCWPEIFEGTRECLSERELLQVSRLTPHKCLSSRIESKLGYASYIWMNPGLFLNVKVRVLLAIHRLSKTRPLPRTALAMHHHFVVADLHTLRLINLARVAMILREFRTRTINPDVVFEKVGRFQYRIIRSLTLRQRLSSCIAV